MFLVIFVIYWISSYLLFSVNLFPFFVDLISSNYINYVYLMMGIGAVLSAYLCFIKLVKEEVYENILRTLHSPFRYSIMAP
jgi:uncharacterized membrane protein